MALPTTGVLSYLNPWAYGNQANSEKSDQPPAYKPLASEPPPPAYTPPAQKALPVYLVYRQPPKQQQMRDSEIVDLAAYSLLAAPTNGPVESPCCCICCTAECCKTCGDVALPIIHGLGHCVVACGVGCCHVLGALAR